MQKYAKYWVKSNWTWFKKPNIPSKVSLCYCNSSELFLKDILYCLIMYQYSNKSLIPLGCGKKENTQPPTDLEICGARFCYDQHFKCFWIQFFVMAIQKIYGQDRIQLKKSPLAQVFNYLIPSNLFYCLKLFNILDDQWNKYFKLRNHHR